MRHTIRSLSILSLLSFSIFAGCDATGSEQAAQRQQQVVFERITQADIAGLSDGEVLIVDGSLDNQVLIFDSKAAPIDFSRIEIIFPNNQQRSMADWVLDVFGEVPSGGEFSFAADPADFGTLSEEQIAVLMEEGVLTVAVSYPSYTYVHIEFTYEIDPDGGVICHADAYVG